MASQDLPPDSVLFPLHSTTSVGDGALIFFMFSTRILLHYERAFHQSSLQKHMEGKSLWQISNLLDSRRWHFKSIPTLIRNFKVPTLSYFFRIHRWMPSSQDDSSTFSLSICFQRSHISGILWSYHPFKYETGNDLEIDWGKISSFLAFALLPWISSLISVVRWFV